MPSPQRLFRSFTPDQLAQLQQAAFDGTLYGQYLSTSGAAKSGTKQRISVETLLIELNAELQARGIQPRRVTKVHEIMSDVRGINIIGIET